jgi:hypothetical protein
MKPQLTGGATFPRMLSQHDTPDAYFMKNLTKTSAFERDHMDEVIKVLEDYYRNEKDKEDRINK